MEVQLLTQLVNYYMMVAVLHLVLYTGGNTTEDDLLSESTIENYLLQKFKEILMLCVGDTDYEY